MTNSPDLLPVGQFSPQNLRQDGNISHQGRVDYLAVTLDETVSGGQWIGLPGVWSEAGRGMYGYKTKLSHASGALAFCEGRAGMGVHIQLSGQVLSKWRDDGATDRDIVQHYHALSAKVTRADAAIDIVGGDPARRTMPKALYEGFQARHQMDAARQVITKVQGARLVDNSDGGQTLYLGAPKSDRFLRVYDKAVESKTIDYGVWVRLELELKNMLARAFVYQVATTENTRAVINGCISDIATFSGYPDIETALDGYDNIHFETPTKIPNRKQWLLTQVVQAMVNQIVEEGNDNTLIAFNMLVEEGLKKAMKGTE